MAQLVLNDKVQAKFFCSQVSQQSINTINFRVSALIGAGCTDVTAAGLLAAVFAPAYKSWMSSEQHYNGLRFQVMGPIKKPFQVSTAGAGVGAVVSNNLPSQNAIVLSLRSDTFGRRARGRLFLPFWTTSRCNADGSITDAAKTLALNFGTILVTPLNLTDAGGDGVTLVPQIWSKKFSQYFDIVTATVDNDWGTQVRRSNINRPDQLGP